MFDSPLNDISTLDYHVFEFLILHVFTHLSIEQIFRIYYFDFERTC